MIRLTQYKPMLIRQPQLPKWLLLALATLTLSACSNPGVNLPLQEPDFAYELDTWMENSEVYEFTMQSNKSYACIMLMLDNGKDMAMDCFPKGPAGKKGKLAPDFSYELDTWLENSEIYEFTPRSNTDYACLMYMLDSGNSVDLKCRLKGSAKTG